MDDNSYPKFEKPTLIEALCEIRYTPLSDDRIKRSFSGLISLLASDYPLFEILDESPFRFNIGGNVISENVHRYKFSSEEHNYLITVKRDAFSFTLNPNANHPYDKKDFYEKLCSEWERMAEELKINDITRIGIRFVNSLKVSLSEMNDKYFNKDSVYIPAVCLQSKNLFFNKNEFQKDNINRFIITTASRGLEGEKELILDIDRIKEGADISSSSVRKDANAIHADIEEVFFSSITDEYRRLMKPI